MTSPHPTIIFFEDGMVRQARHARHLNLGPMGLRLHLLGRRCVEGGLGEGVLRQWLRRRFGLDGLDGPEIPARARERVHGRCGRGGSRFLRGGRNLKPVKPVGPKFASMSLFSLYSSNDHLYQSQAQLKQFQAHQAQSKKPQNQHEADQ